MKILVAGGSGLVGTALIKKLIAQQHEVVNLTINKDDHGRIIHGALQVFWNPPQAFIQDQDTLSCDAVVNLAGFPISKRWTNRNKQLLISSRLDSTRTLVALMEKKKITPHVYVQASASGYYPSSNAVMNEDSPAGNDFLAQLVQQWEAASSKLNQTEVRRVVLRFGMVLGKEGGALKQLVPLFKMGFGSALGNGKQFVSWINVDDVADMIIHAIQHNQVHGIYNASSPQVVSNKVFSKTLAQVLHKPFFLPNVPAFALKMVLGEMASILLASQNLSADKIMRTGFAFKYDDLKNALEHLSRPSN
jgi:uncharacterized protein (TIGR01777 family)